MEGKTETTPNGHNVKIKVTFKEEGTVITKKTKEEWENQDTQTAELGLAESDSFV